MHFSQHIFATCIIGVLYPDSPLNLPESARIQLMIQPIEVTLEQELRGRKTLSDLRQRNIIRLGNWHPTRDELHVRR